MAKSKEKARKHISIKKQFSEAISYLRETKYYVYASFFIFLVAVLIGYFFPNSFSQVIDPIIKDLVARSSGLGPGEMIFFILQNNIWSSFLAMILGIVFGILPIFDALVNGVIVGYVIQKVVMNAGIIEIWRLFPHGIFELPAAFISMGLGIKLGWSIFVEKNKGKEFVRRFYNSINTFLMIVVPLLIIAAIIEGSLIFIFR